VRHPTSCEALGTLLPELSNSKKILSRGKACEPTTFRTTMKPSLFRFPKRFQRRLYRSHFWMLWEWQCPICGYWSWTLQRALACFKQCRAKICRDDNFSILQSKGINNLRRDLAIYRLYRYCDVSPKEIAKFLKKKDTWVRERIGKIFKMLCLADKQCLFRDYFQ